MQDPAPASLASPAAESEPGEPTASAGAIELLRASEARYRALVETMAQGFCVVEIVVDAAGDPVDYRFLEANPRFAEHTGLADVVGRTIRELVPAIEPHWIDRYAEVARTGVPARFEAPAAAVGRWFEVEATRVGPAAARQVAVLFTDVTARRRAADALRESERRFREMADHAPVMLWMTEVDGRCTFLNRPWYAFTGQTETEALGDGFGWLAAVHPDDRAEAERVFREATAAATPFRLDYRLRHRDGAYRWCIDAAAPRVAADGTFLGFVGSVVDVHERRVAEARVQASETLLSAVLDALPVGVIIADATGRLVRDNAANRALWGVPPDTTSWGQYGEWVGWWPETGRRIAAEEWAMARALLGGETVRGELVANLPFDARPAGAPVPPFAEAAGRRYYLNNAAPVRDAEGRIVGAVVAELDITAQVAAEAERAQLLAAERAARAEAQAERAQLRAVFDQLPVGAVLVEAPTGRILLHNAAGERLLGHPMHPSADVSGYAAFGALHVDGTPYAPHEYPTARALAGEVVDQHVMRYRRGDGRVTHLAVSAAPILDAEGRLVRAVSTWTDVDERVAMEDALRTARDAAERSRDEAEAAYAQAQSAYAEAAAANRSKSEFLATMSHELRTPLNAIQGHVQLLEMGLHGPVSAAQQEALGRVGRAQRHLLALITDVLNFARLEAGRLAYRLEAVELAAVVPEVGALLAPEFDERGLRFVVTPPPAPCRVRADREKLAQVLLNLLANAAKFTPAGGTVTLDVVGPAGDDGVAGVWVHLRVTDSGIGIPDEQQERVFEPFVQVSSGRTRTHEGAGLGLAISRELARGMGGDLRVESAVAVGSTFTLTLPAVP